jgi:hypothetical protein
VQNNELIPDLLAMNDLDSSKQAGLIYWNDDIKNYILHVQNGTYPKQGYIKGIMQEYRIDEETATKFCEARLLFFMSKFKMPIDFFYYRDNCYYSNRRDMDDENNATLCVKKFKLVTQ